LALRFRSRATLPRGVDAGIADSESSNRSNGSQAETVSAPRGPVFALAFTSGFVGLGYQVVWFRLDADRFGSTILTFLLVLVSFIGGLGLGSLASNRVARRLGRLAWLSDPLAVVGVIEIGIALTALSTLFLDPSGIAGRPGFHYRADARGIYEPSLLLHLAPAIASALILVPTFLMGTTFPILCRRFREHPGFPSELYAWNTLGACSGILASEFFLLKYLGQTHAFLALTGLNAVLGAAFFALSRRRARPAEARAVGRRRRPRSAGASARSVLDWHPASILLVACVSGFLSGALEVDQFRAVRFAGAITDAAMSFTSFWAIVAIFLASAFVRWLGRPRPWLVRCAVVGALLAHFLVWQHLHEIRGVFNQRYMDFVVSHADVDPGVRDATIYPLSASLLLLLGFTGVVVVPAYFLISLLLPTVCNAIQANGGHLGLAYGLNTLAFCTGAALFTFVVPRVHLFYAAKVLLFVLGAGALLLLTLRVDRPVSLAAATCAALLVAGGAAFVSRDFDRSFFPSYEMPAMYPVRAVKSNGLVTTYVVRHPEGDILFFDSHPMSGTGLSGQRYMRLMAHVPLLAHPDPRKALLICFGVGNTAAAIAAHEEIGSIDIVDLNDTVFETADEFRSTNGRVCQDPRVRLIHDDGRRFLRGTNETYDLVTSEPPPPRGAGVYRLYSVEYYRSVLEHLTPQGMMTQWLPIGILSRDASDRMVASFVRVFPHTLLFVGSGEQLILLGSREPFDPAVLERRFGASSRVQADLATIGIREPVEILARIVRTDASLRADVEAASSISDERNDLALAVTDPFDPPMVSTDARSVLSSLITDDLRCGSWLTAVLLDPSLRRKVVPDLEEATARWKHSRASLELPAPTRAKS
jgi:spermidine synthase